MDRLPDEILLKIFQFVKDCRERTRLERVCRKWRKIMLDRGWQHLRRIQGSPLTEWIVPIGQRCGGHLDEFSFYMVNIDSRLIHLIAKHFPALKHLDFRCSEMIPSDANALESLRWLGGHLRSLTFYNAPEEDYRYRVNHHFLRRLPRLQHLGLHFHYSAYPSNHFPADLRSLYLNSYSTFRPDLNQMLKIVQRDCPRLTALYLDIPIYNDPKQPQQTQQLLSRISNLKNLRFLRIAFCHIADPNLLCSFLDNFPQLLGLQLKLPVQQLSADLFRFPSFRRLLHLAISISAQSFDNFEPIGLLSSVAPQLRSLCLDIHVTTEQTREIGCEVLKIARNGNLEHLDVPCTSFTVKELEQIIRDCPNLHSFGARLPKNEQLAQVAELKHVVAEQWCEGRRKHVPLRFWVYGQRSQACWPNPFLPIHIFQVGYCVPSNPVLEALFQDEVFNDRESGGTPLFVKEHYSSKV